MRVFLSSATLLLTALLVGCAEAPTARQKAARSESANDQPIAVLATRPSSTREVLTRRPPTATEREKPPTPLPGRDLPNPPVRGRVPGDQPAPVGQPVPVVKAEPLPANAADKYLQQLNDARVNISRLPLENQATLTKVAQEYAKLAAKEQNSNPAGKSLFDLVKDAGYKFKNISTRVDLVQQGGVESLRQLAKQPPIADTAVKADFTDVGIGIGTGANGFYYVVTIFAAEQK